MHGISYGLALDMSLSCDVRISTDDTKFSVKEVDIGLAADIGTLSRLPHAVGNMSWVKDVALSARVFGSEEALRVGLVSRVAKDKEAALKEVSSYGFSCLRSLDSIVLTTCIGSGLGCADCIKISHRGAWYQGDHQLQPRQDSSRGVELHCRMERGYVADGRCQGSNAKWDAEAKSQVC